MRVIASLCAGTLISGCGAPPAPRRPMQLQRVVLYQNGIGHFERTGHLTSETLRLDFARGELDDVLKTLTVIDRLGAGVATVDVPNLETADKAKPISLGVRMSAGRVHDLTVSYAVPTPTWKAAYRVVMDDGARDAPSLLQGWAMVNNASQEDWTGVQLTLVTGAPMSFVHDLHTPQYVKRPDVHGNMVAPALGPIANERSIATDSDNDGILDAVDVCPDSREDRDSVDDDDGCPDRDNDRDRILDLDDKCPNEPESYNGFDDEDGCPDRGRVVVTDTAIEVLDQIFFPKGSDVMALAAVPIVEAIAATLAGNPSIAKIEIGGHATADEGEAWGLSSRRAAAVRAALVARGIAASRLVLVPYGATRSIDTTDSDRARDRNRRVDFLIVQRRDDTAPVAPRRAPPQITTTTARTAAHTTTRPAEVAGTVRYELGEPVSIHKGTSSMVSILNKPIAAHDVYLFRPDANAPGTDRHPFRAVRLVNDSGYMLEPGPIAIFARGSFVGDSMVGRLAVGETAWIPYAVDGATSVTVERDDRERPVRIVAIQRGTVTVETLAVRTTKYAIAAGRDPAQQIYIRHSKLDGYVTKDLPPGTLDRGDSYLVPLPLQPAKVSVLTLEERQPRRHAMQLLDAGTTELGLYVEGSNLPAPMLERLRETTVLRKQMGAHEETIEAARTRLGDLAARADELRENIKVLAGVRGAEDTRKKLLASLTATTTDADAQAKKLGIASEALATTRNTLQESLRELSLDE